MANAVSSHGFIVNPENFNKNKRPHALKEKYYLLFLLDICVF